MVPLAATWFSLPLASFQPVYASSPLLYSLPTTWRAVLCLSRSWAVRERSDSLCCWRAGLLLSLSYCRLSSLKRFLLQYLWTRSPAWRRCLSSKSSIVLWALAHQEGHVPEGTYTIRKLVYLHTYKHNLRLRPHKCPLRPHDYVPHAKAFSNKHGFLHQKHTSCEVLLLLTEGHAICDRILSSTCCTVFMQP